MGHVAGKSAQLSKERSRKSQKTLISGFQKTQNWGRVTENGAYYGREEGGGEGGGEGGREAATDDGLGEVEASLPPLIVSH